MLKESWSDFIGFPRPLERDLYLPVSTFVCEVFQFSGEFGFSISCLNVISAETMRGADFFSFIYKAYL